MLTVLYEASRMKKTERGARPFLMPNGEMILFLSATQTPDLFA